MINILFLHAGAEMYGADKVLFDLIRNLDKKEYAIHVVLPTEGVLVDKLKDEGIDINVVPYPIMRRKYFNARGIIKYAIDFIRYSNKLSKYAESKKIQIIHNNTAAVLEGSYISKKTKIPQLWEIHEIIVKPKLIFNFTSLAISRFAKKVVTVSEASRKHLASSGFFVRKNIDVIYNGIDSDRFRPGLDCRYLYEEWNIPQNANVIGMVGRVNSWKGQESFLEAANIVMGSNKATYTLFVGSAFAGEEWREKNLREQIHKSPYSDRIRMVGYRTDSENIFNMLDVFVLPSINPDPLPTVVLEAMGCGKPIVAYRHGGVCEMVKEGYNGLFADINNVADLAEKIGTLLADDVKRQLMGQNSRQRLVEKFSMDAYVEQYEKLYKEIAG